jgi:hypothetical protein
VKSESDLVLRYLYSAEIVIPLSRAYLLGSQARGPPLVLNTDPPEMVSSEKSDQPGRSGVSGAEIRNDSILDERGQRVGP